MEPMQVARYLYLVTLMPAASAVAGALAHGAQMQAGTGVVQEVGRTQRNDDGQIGQEAVGQEHLAEPAGGRGAGQRWS